MNHQQMLIILTSLTLAWIVFMLMPLGMFQLAAADFQLLGCWELLAYASLSAILLAALVAVALACVRTRFPRAFPYGMAFVLSLAFLLYLQGNLIGLNYGLLDGQPIDWAVMRVGGLINSAVWIVGLVGGTLLLDRLIRRNREAAILTAFVFLCYVAVISACNFSLSPAAENRVARLDDGNLMELSSGRNLIIFILDSYDRGLLDFVLERHPSVRQDFSGFTYFHNATGCFSGTMASVPQLVTGHVPVPDEVSDAQHREQCYADAPFLDEASRRGFEVDLYTDPEAGPHVGEARRFGCFGNVGASDVSLWSRQNLGMFRSLMRVSWFRYLPHAFKPWQWDYLMRRGFSCTNADGEDRGIRTERLLLENLASGGGFTLVSKRKVKIYHLNGVHTPKFTPEQGLASLDLVKRYRVAVEKAGLADCTTFIVLADHGVVNRSHPIFLCSNDSKTFIEDNRPVSYRHMGEIWSSALTNRVAVVPTAKPEEMCLSSPDKTLMRNPFFDNAITVFRGRLLELIRLSPNMDTTGDYENERIVWDGAPGFLAIPIASSLRGHPLEISFVCEAESKTETWTKAVSVEDIDPSGTFVRIMRPAWSSATPPLPIVSISVRAVPASGGS